VRTGTAAELILAGLLRSISMEDAMNPIARALLTSLLVILLGFVAFAYWSGTAWERYPRPVTPPVAATTGIIDDAAIASKIKAKMVLDDYVKARSIAVTSKGATVTLRGTVRSVDEHDRALQIARETSGVAQVVDELRVQNEP
jgi:hypothetical protein